jgi:hypothetical protein
MARLLARAMDADVAVLVSEIWQGPPCTKEERDKYKNVRDMPGARDMVMFSIETPAGTWMAHCAVAPHKGRTPRFIEDPVFKPVGGVEGRMVGFLPVRGTKQ